MLQALPASDQPYIEPTILYMNVLLWSSSVPYILLVSYICTPSCSIEFGDSVQISGSHRQLHIFKAEHFSFGDIKSYVWHFYFITFLFY